MNHIQPHTSWSTAWALPDARQVAQEAIAHHDLPRLESMLDAQEVDANTRTAGGGTLVIEAIRCLNARAFAAMVRDPAVIDFNIADTDGNTALHHLALRMTDEVLDDVWEQMLTALLEQREPDIDWELTNRDDQTALDLVAMDGRDRIAELFDPYAPEESSPTHSSHRDSYTDEEAFSDLGSEHFENLSPQEHTRVMSLFERFLQQKRGR